jgi:uncharacterized repeat protein (TIGR01451 family)
MKKAQPMNIKTMLSHRVALSLLLLAALNAHAQTATKPCIDLKNEAQVQEKYTDAQGKPATRLVAPGKVIPGNEIVYTITATNVCDKPVNAVVINNAVPEHMTYVMNSAMGVGTDITYSIDGKSFARLETLSVKNAEGVTHTPNAEDIKSIHWLYSTAINPGQSGFVRFRATVK